MMLQLLLNEIIKSEGIRVGHKPLCKMPRQDRAKQFMPFSALKGLEEALADVERELQEKSADSPDDITDITT